MGRSQSRNRRQGHEGKVPLFLTFIRPMELFLIVELEIVRQGILVEQILTGNAEAVGNDDRLIKNLDRPNVMVEAPALAFEQPWNDLFHKHLAKDYRIKGLSRSDSRRAARSAIEELRKLNSPRMRDIHE